MYQVPVVRFGTPRPGSFSATKLFVLIALALKIMADELVKSPAHGDTETARNVRSEPRPSAVAISTVDLPTVLEDALTSSLMTYVSAEPDRLDDSTCV